MKDHMKMDTYTHLKHRHTTTAVLLMTKVQAASDFQLPTFDIP